MEKLHKGREEKWNLGSSETITYNPKSKWNLFDVQKDKGNIRRPKAETEFKKNLVRIYYNTSLETVRDVYIKNENINLPIRVELNHILLAIQDSNKILLLQDNWDDEGALKIAPKVYWNAIKLLIYYANCVLEQHKIVIKAPEINPGRNGSIDLDWRCSGRELLLSIQNSDNLNIHYYGDDGNDNTVIKGFLSHFGINEDLTFWMRKLV